MDTYLTAGQIKSALANTPQITFEVTDACNLRCEYCAYGKLYADYDKREDKMLSVEAAKRFIDYMAALWASPENRSIYNNVYIGFYGGEPLLNMPFIKEIVGYLKLGGHAKHFSYNMTTNAMLLDRCMDFFIENDFSLLISLDGNAENDSYRIKTDGKPSFEQVTANIDKLRTNYPDYFAKKVNFNAVLHNRNSVNSIRGFVKERYGKMPRIGDINDTGIRDDMKEEFMRMYRNSYESLLQNENYDEIEKEMFLSSPTYHSATVFLMQNSPFKYENYNELLYGKNENEVFCPTGTCVPFSRKVFVSVSGKILPCERIGHQYSVGQVDDKGVMLYFEAIAEKYNNYYSRLEKQCRLCKNRRNCIQCMFNLDGLENGQCVCKGFMDEEQFAQYRQTQLAFFARHPEAYSEIMKNVIYK